MKFFIILLYIFSVNSWSQADRREIYLKQSFAAIKDGNYPRARAILERRFVFNNAGKNPALFYKLSSIVYKKLGYYKKAHQSIYFVILKEHRAENQKVMSHARAGRKTKVSEPLLKNYYAQFTLLVMDYKTYPSPKLLRQINFLSKLLKSQNYQVSQVNLLLENLNDFDSTSGDESNIEIDEKVVEEVAKAPPSEQVRWNFFFGIQELSWQERISVARPNLDEEGLLVTSQGTCFGAGAERWSHAGAWSFSGCFTSAVATVSSDAKRNIDSNFDYAQSGVPLNTVLLTSGYMFRLPARQSLIGFHVPIIYRNGDFDDTPAGDVVNEKVLVDVGLMLGYRYFFENMVFKRQHLSLDFKVGRFLQNSSLFWSVGIMYHFDFSKL